MLAQHRLRGGVRFLANGKVPGSDGIPPEVTRIDKKTVLVHHLYQVLLDYLEEDTVLQDIRSANIIVLNKHKGKFSDCNIFM
ncbi:hypothetical protein ElyMa_005942100 [Elysia marginata]|uniref:Uncharacterized protein n=1 Tax=Elysia marginata TaxID=1093978 RepID=A0AAV4GA60_9GAST|nr:hypothetical protein ElyMa_005942100 [Elysia marginata]